MSVVSTDAQVVYRTTRGYADPALPQSMWVGVGSVEGDASGGLRTVTLNLKAAAAALATEAFSLEQVSVVTLETADRSLEITSGNFDFVEGLPSDVIYSARSLLDAATTQAIMDPSTLGLPVFLGRPKLANAAAFLNFEAVNVNLVALIVHAQGYRWDGAAMAAPGGPQRPPNGVYGS